MLIVGSNFRVLQAYALVIDIPAEPHIEIGGGQGIPGLNGNKGDTGPPGLAGQMGLP